MWCSSTPRGGWGECGAGTVAPDSFYVHKPSFVAGYRAALKRSLGSKEKKMVFTDTLNTGNIAQEYTANIDTPSEEQTRFCLSDADVMVLADYAIKVENHYSSNAGAYKPMDMSGRRTASMASSTWSRRARNGGFAEKRQRAADLSPKQRSPVLLRGKAVGTRIGAGIARVVNDVKQLSVSTGRSAGLRGHHTGLGTGDETAAAIVTNRGGRTCHAAIVARELGIPAIVGAANAAALIKTGTSLTVSCAEGENGTVYEGILEFEVEETDLSQLGHPDTHIMMNLANPDRAFSPCLAAGRRHRPGAHGVHHQ
jgi:pyruvate,water dikinase